MSGGLEEFRHFDWLGLWPTEPAKKRIADHDRFGRLFLAQIDRQNKGHRFHMVMTNGAPTKTTCTARWIFALKAEHDCSGSRQR